MAINMRAASMEQSINSSFDHSQLSSPACSASAQSVFVERSELILASHSIDMERLQQSLANAALPALLPTPPRSEMLVPRIQTRCLIILPTSSASPSNPKPGRADSVDRWDAHKTSAWGVSVSPPPTERRAADGGRSISRADACDRWDINKTSVSRSNTPSSSSSSSFSSKMHRSSSSSSSPARSSSSRASSDERWDIHEKPRLQAGALDGKKLKDGNAMTMSRTDKDVSNALTMSHCTKEARASFAGPSFTSPEPRLLPFPKFLLAH
ncbi:hypothetical protein ABZP36_013258 [Zizania latifolia]